MMGRLLYSQTNLRRTGVAERSIDRAEWMLFLVTVCVLLFVLGLWMRSAIIGATPPVMATITVQSGDTLWSLAKEYGDPQQYILERVNALAKANGLDNHAVLHEGQSLVIPVGNKSAKLYYGGKYANRQIAE